MPVPVRHLFTYALPETLEGATPGCRAVAPLGRRTLTGVIAEITGTADLEPEKIRDLISLTDRIPVMGKELLETLVWAARYYVTGPGSMLALALPPGGRGGHGAGEAREGFYSLVRSAEESLEACARAPRQRDVIRVLSEESREVSASSLRARLGEVTAQLAALRRKGLVRRQYRPVRRRPGILEPAGRKDRVRLTAEQREAVEAVSGGLDSGEYRGFLLMGPTGSGKTEVYLHAMEEALRRGRTAAYLVPEIALTPLLARTLKERFGESFALLHSSLSPAERRAEWRRVQAGEARVVLGPRSALLAPLDRPGLIVVDEEQDGSFKQESDPRYNARDLSMVRAQRAGAVSLLGSATPSMETFRLAETGRLGLLTLSERIQARPLSPVELVDMRREAEETGGDDPISRSLRTGLRECLDRGEQAIVLLNRRGWAPSILCRKCGESVKCKRCSIALTWHKRDRRLLCHYCGYQRGLPRRCPGCGGERLHLVGEGTERLAEDLAALFPGARMARLDRDVARGRTEPGRILSGFEEGRYDLLVGTQLVAKGHDFPGVTLVGVVSADFGLGFPDFRAAERTFQLLTQVAGRAGRGEKPGRVVVQAFRPDHYAIQAATRQDYRKFYARESRFRRLMGYPPWSAMANVVASARRPETALRRARTAAAAIRQAGGGDLRVTGPALAPLSLLKGRYRFQVMVRASRRRLLSDALNEALDRLEKGGSAGGRDLIVDVDPTSLL